VAGQRRSDAPDQHHQEADKNIRLAARHANLIVARAAIDRAIVLWQERHLSLGSALCANHRVHLARSTLGTPAQATFSPATRTATRTAAGLIHQTFLLVKLLFSGGEDKIGSAFAAFESLVNETQTKDLLVI
jgi:hypothetical protein